MTPAYRTEAAYRPGPTRPRLVSIDSSEGDRTMNSVIGGVVVDASIFSAVGRRLGAAGFAGRMYGPSRFGLQGRRFAEVRG
jgi:hypothetical protein